MQPTLTSLDALRTEVYIPADVITDELIERASAFLGAPASELTWGIRLTPPETPLWHPLNAFPASTYAGVNASGRVGPASLRLNAALVAGVDSFEVASVDVSVLPTPAELVEDANPIACTLLAAAFERLLDETVDVFLAGSDLAAIEGSLLVRDLRASTRPGFVRLVGVLDAHLARVQEAEAARSRLAADRERARAQLVLDEVGAGRLHKVALDLFAKASETQLLGLIRASVTAYPQASARGGFFYLTGRPAGFDEVYEARLHEESSLLVRYERTRSLLAAGSEARGLDSAIMDEVPISAFAGWHDLAAFRYGSLADLAVFLTDPVRFMTRVNIEAVRAEDADARDMSRMLALSTMVAAPEVLALEALASSDPASDLGSFLNGPASDVELATELALALAGWVSLHGDAGDALSCAIMPHLPAPLRILLACRHPERPRLAKLLSHAFEPLDAK